MIIKEVVFKDGDHSFVISLDLEIETKKALDIIATIKSVCDDIEENLWFGSKNLEYEVKTVN